MTDHYVEEAWVPSYSKAFGGGRVDDCGAGNLFYPGGERNVALPSVRVKRIRDGVNDYEYLAQLRAASKLLQERKPDGWEKLLCEANDLMNFSPNLVDPPQADFLSWSAQFGQAASLFGIVNANVYNSWKRSEHSPDEGQISLTSHPSAVREGGQAALRLLPEAGELSAWQDILASPGKEHSASAYIKTDDLKGKAFLRIEYLDAQKKVLQSADSKQQVSGSTGGKTFQKIDARLPVSPEKMAFLRITLACHRDPGQGRNDKEPLAKAFFDDVSATSGNQALEIANPGFEEKIRYDEARTQDFFAFRDRLADCLDRICAALNETGPFAGAHPGRERP